MKTLRKFFGSTLILIGMAGLATAGVKQQVNQAKDLLQHDRLNEAAQKLIETHGEVCNGMYEIIQRYSPHSEILINQTNCNENVQRRGRAFESPIIISAWAEDSFAKVTRSVLFEYIQRRTQKTGETLSSCFSFYNESEEDRYYYGCCCFCKGDRAVDLAKAMDKFLTKKIGKASMPGCAKWWNENFCRTAASLLNAYVQKFNTHPENFTLVDTYYFLMTYKVYTESDAGNRGQLVFAQENFTNVCTAVHNMLAHLLLHPGVNAQAKSFVLTAVANWNNPIYQNLGKVGNVDVRPIGYYQVEIGALDNAMRIASSNYVSHQQAIAQPIQIMQKAHGEWTVAYQQTLQGWERHFQEILNPQPQPSTSGYKHTPTMHVTPGYMEQTQFGRFYHPSTTTFQ